MTVRVQGATKSFGRRTVLHSVDLDAGQGVTGLLGPNGAGKTNPAADHRHRPGAGPGHGDAAGP